MDQTALRSGTGNIEPWRSAGVTAFLPGRNSVTVDIAQDYSRRIRFVGRFDRVQYPDSSGVSAASSLGMQRVEAVPETSFDLGLLGTVSATMTGSLCRTLVDHCHESTTHGREVGGFLVGYLSASRALTNLTFKPHFDLVVTNVVPVRALSSSKAHFSICEEEWNKAELEIQRAYAPQGKTRLGWYHTHPDQGIFFSTKDRTAHEVFAEPHQFALVVDPRNMEAGLFHWSSNGTRSVAGPICFPLIRRRR